MATTLGRKKQGYHHGRLRAALVDVALELIEERGVQALTLRELARRVGVTHAAPYRHFRDKASLVAAVAEEGFNRLTEQLRQQRTTAAEEALAPEVALRQVAAAYVRFAMAHPEHFRVMFNAERVTSRSAALQQACAAVVGELAVSVATAVRCGTVRAGDAHQATTILWTQLHGLAVLITVGYLAPTGGVATEPTVATTPAGALATSQAASLTAATVDALLAGLGTSADLDSSGGSSDGPP